ncbi:MAG: hypothetical protein ABI894_03910 [Ilumatobacteraceae bacterium]
MTAADVTPEEVAIGVTRYRDFEMGDTAQRVDHVLHRTIGAIARVSAAALRLASTDVAGFGQRARDASVEVVDVAFEVRQRAARLAGALYAAKDASTMSRSFEFTVLSRSRSSVT